jgi:hypothetical protein
VYTEGSFFSVFCHSEGISIVVVTFFERTTTIEIPSE